ncbi:hypothetical protein LINGRAHAP2_LOCUS32746 [Linum grandiflorum]
MKAVLLRTSSNKVHAPVCNSSPKKSPGSPKIDSLTGMFAWDHKTTSPNKSVHLEISSPTRRIGSTITRSMSESDMLRCFNDGVGMKKMSQSASRSSLYETVPRNGNLNDQGAVVGSTSWNSNKDQMLGVGIRDGFSEDLAFPGQINGGNGGNRGSGFGRGGGEEREDGDYKKRMIEYYEQIIKSNPRDSLLLRNYGKFLYEVEGDVKRAEEYYGRALLESPGDGEVLSLYANLIWNNYKDQHRAFTYFHHAASASPNDCMVLGSYAHFMWVTEVEEKGGEEDVPQPAAPPRAPAMVPAF